jgi:hypothetical protein
MDEQTKKNSHGFTWGMIVGGAVVLMLTTKRGRSILKEISEGGIDGLDQYLDIDKIKALTSEFDDEDEVDSEEEAPVKEKSVNLDVPAHIIKPENEKFALHKTSVSVKKSVRKESKVENKVPSEKIDPISKPVKKPRLFKRKK